MIQRIQSLYLLLSALFLTAFLFFDIVWQSQAAQAFPWFTPLLLALGGLTAVVALASIFLYSDRRRQRKMVLGGQVLTVLLVLAFFGGLYLGGELDVAPGGVLNVSKLIALLLPVLAYIMFFMARRAIENDIELVRSMDRLR